MNHIHQVNITYTLYYPSLRGTIIKYWELHKLRYDQNSFFLSGVYHGRKSSTKSMHNSVTTCLAPAPNSTVTLLQETTMEEKPNSWSKLRP